MFQLSVILHVLSVCNNHIYQKLSFKKKMHVFPSAEKIQQRHHSLKNISACLKFVITVFSTCHLEIFPGNNFSCYPTTFPNHTQTINTLSAPFTCCNLRVFLTFRLIIYCLQGLVLFHIMLAAIIATEILQFLLFLHKFQLFLQKADCFLRSCPCF